VNSVNITARLTRDPDMVEPSPEAAVCNLRVAIERGGEGAVFVDVKAFGAQATACADYLSKGDPVAIVGRPGHSPIGSKWPPSKFGRARSSARARPGCASCASRGLAAHLPSARCRSLAAGDQVLVLPAVEERAHQDGEETGPLASVSARAATLRTPHLGPEPSPHTVNEDRRLA
jgi:hypothetical protein